MIFVYITYEKRQIYTNFLPKSLANMKITWGQCPCVPKENGGLVVMKECVRTPMDNGHGQYKESPEYINTLYIL